MRIHIVEERLAQPRAFPGVCHCEMDLANGRVWAATSCHTTRSQWGSAQAEQGVRNKPRQERRSQIRQSVEFFVLQHSTRSLPSRTTGEKIAWQTVNHDLICRVWENAVTCRDLPRTLAPWFLGIGPAFPLCRLAISSLRRFI
jgi:hypothetical protein